MHYKDVMEKDEEISRPKDHGEKWLAQVKKTKVTKKELKKHLSEQEEGNLCLKNLNKNLLEQIRSLKDEENDTKDKVINSKNEELSRLRNYNQNLLMQIKKLKSDKNLLKDKLEQFNQEEVSKSPIVTVHVENKGTDIDPVNITTQGEDKPTVVKIYSEVAVQTSDISSEDSI